MIAKSTRPRVIIGAALILFILGLIWLRSRPLVPPAQFDFAWQMVSGLILLGLYAHQWVLEIYRLQGHRSMLPAAKNRHFLVGLGFIALFALHMPRAGHGVTLALTIAFVANAITGLIHPIVAARKHQRLLFAWTIIHVGLSVALAPLIAAHIWFAIAIK